MQILFFRDNFIYTFHSRYNYYCYFHFYFVEELSIHLHVCNDVNVISLSSIIILRLCSDLFQENSNEEGEFQVCFILLFSKINTQPVPFFRASNVARFIAATRSNVAKLEQVFDEVS